MSSAVAELVGTPMQTPPTKVAAERIETEELMSGWLAALDQFDEADIHRVCQGYLRRLRERAVDVLDAGSLVGTGHRS